MTKIIASDYKGKWFVLEDEDNSFGYERKEINVDWVMGEGLQDHVENCRYYGIPAYTGSDKDLNEKIEKINKKIDFIEGDTSKELSEH